MKVSYILNHRGSEGSRFDNLISVLDLLSTLEAVNVILVEQDEKPYLADLNLSYPSLKYIFAYNHELFNRSWGFNIGFKYAAGDVLAFSDTDIFMNPDELVHAFRACHGPYDAVNPYSQIIDLSEGYTKQIRCNAERLHRCATGHWEGEARPGTVFCGGLVLFKRSTFERIGGFDERFCGWGGEDDAMAFVLRELLENPCEMPYTAYHLWHERTIQDTNEQPNYLNNLGILQAYPSLTRDELILMCQNSRRSMGNPDKYKPSKKALRL